ncbi:MAG: hypothetical protein ACI9DH_000091 [Halioglobus sp.]|jgi:uncharacterized protein (DUF885 family)
MKKLICCILFSVVAGVANADPASDFHTLLDEIWHWEVQQSPEQKTYLGLDGPDNKWTDHSLAAYTNRYEARGFFLDALADIEIKQLSPDDQLSYSMIKRQLRESRQREVLGLNLMRVNMRQGPQHRHSILQFTILENAAAYRDWIARMRGIPKLLAQHTELLRQGIKLDRVQPRELMQRVPAQLDNVITDNPQDSPYYKPFHKFPDSVDTALAKKMRIQAQEIISTQVTPAFREFKQFFESTYLAASRPQPGIGSLPGGKDIYRFLAAHFTTTTLTPEEIHAIGSREVARILLEMEQVKESVEFNGDLHAFNEFLRSDPQFYYDSPEALLEGYRAVSKRLDPELVKLFRKLPRMPYGVIPIPSELAPDTTTAYYSGPAANGSRPGYYHVNLYRPEVRPKYEMEVLSVHEAVPGHHLQIALAQELEGVPDFRKHSGVTAFVEGWGLYSEGLGYEMGLYQDPYSRYGQLTYDMWRAVRLVVDTGIHYFGWSRQRAIDYFLAHAGKSEADIINEIDRYIGWPGQALAYKIGQIKMLELRQKAEKKLGDEFDIRAFHDELLGAGAIPLDALDSRMNSWISAQ